MPTQTPVTAESSVASLPNGRWVVDPERSTAEFTAKGSWGLASVKGAFKDISGELDIANGEPSGQLVLGAESLDTGNKKRDKHLRSPDFFNVERHPDVVFSVRSLGSRPGGQTTLDGVLKVRETSHPLSIDVTVTQVGGGDLRLSGTTRVERADVGLTWNKMGMMRGDVGLSADVYLVRG